MPEFPLFETPGMQRAGGQILATGKGVVITAGAANVKGAWGQLVAATAYDTGFVTVYIQGGSAAANYLVDIGVGAGGSERVVIPDLLMQCTVIGKSGWSYQFPLCIPAGSRVAARVQCSTLSATVAISTSLGDCGVMSFPPFQGVVAWGATAASSTGSIVDPGVVAFTKGLYTQLIASTVYPVRWINIGFGRLAAGGTVDVTWQVDLAIGAAAFERIIVADVAIDFNATGDIPMPATVMFPVSIPVGSRIAARAACNITTATARNINTMAYGSS